MLRNLLILHCLFFICLGSSQLHAQKYEAENATLSGGANKQESAAASGGFYVAQEEGNLAFTITIEEEGFFDLYLQASAPGGEKINVLDIGGSTLDFTVEQSSAFKKLKIVSGLKLPAGEHQVKILKSWGWINIDYLELERVEASERFNIDQTLVTQDPTPEAAALYNFLLDNYGKKIISGAMTLNDRANSTWIDWIEEVSGKEVALWGIDFMHSFRHDGWYDDRAPVKDAKNIYEQNGIPSLMWHWRDPSRITNEFYADQTNFDVSKISDENSDEYKAIVEDIDQMAVLFLELQEDNVPALWRPMHEAAGGWFWWGAKGPEPLKALWHLMYDRMVKHHGIRNLIWVWTREPNDDEWYPGDEYVDMVARDIYKEGDHGSHVLEFNQMNSLYGGRKMLTIGEIGSIPDPDELMADEAGWSWFMPWYNEHTVHPKWNSEAIWKKVMNHEYVITLDEMPDLSTYERQNAPDPEPEPTGLRGEDARNHRLLAYPVPVINDLVIRDEEGKLETIMVYNAMGNLLKQQKADGKVAVVPFSDLPPGMYILRVNQTKIIKVVKE